MQPIIVVSVDIRQWHFGQYQDRTIEATGIRLFRNLGDHGKPLKYRRETLAYQIIVNVCDLPSPNQLILTEGIQMKRSRVWVVKAILDLRGHTNPVPG